MAFPTIGHFFHLRIPLPTFGVVMVVAFIVSYRLFLSGMRRLNVVPEPRKLMDKLLLWCGIMGLIGAIILEKIDQYFGSQEPFWSRIFVYTGVNFYGALLFGAVTYFIITTKNRIPFPVAADIGSIGMMAAYAVGRMGCHLSGDGDWGAYIHHPRPSFIPAFLWSSTYAHNILRQGIPLPQCDDIYNYCTQLVAPVYPTPLYESLVSFLLFLLLWSQRNRIRRPGIIFGLYGILAGMERFLIELIRVNPHYHVLGLRLSQAQIFALGWIITGLTSLCYFSRKAVVSHRLPIT